MLFKAHLRLSKRNWERFFLSILLKKKKIYIQKTASKMQKKGEKEEEDGKNILDKNNHERRINEKRLKLLF